MERNAARAEPRHDPAQIGTGGDKLTTWTLESRSATCGGKAADARGEAIRTRRGRDADAAYGGTPARQPRTALASATRPDGGTADKTPPRSGGARLPACRTAYPLRGGASVNRQIVPFGVTSTPACVAERPASSASSSGSMAMAQDHAGD